MKTHLGLHTLLIIAKLLILGILSSRASAKDVWTALCWDLHTAKRYVVSNDLPAIKTRYDTRIESSTNFIPPGIVLANICETYYSPFPTQEWSDTSYDSIGVVTEFTATPPPVPGTTTQYVRRSSISNITLTATRDVTRERGVYTFRLAAIDQRQFDVASNLNARLRLCNRATWAPRLYKYEYTNLVEVKSIIRSILGHFADPTKASAGGSFDKYFETLQSDGTNRFYPASFPCLTDVRLAEITPELPAEYKIDGTNISLVNSWFDYTPGRALFSEGLGDRVATNVWTLYLPEYTSSLPATVMLADHSGYASNYYASISRISDKYLQVKLMLSGDHNVSRQTLPDSTRYVTMSAVATNALIAEGFTCSDYGWGPVPAILSNMCFQIGLSTVTNFSLDSGVFSTNVALGDFSPWIANTNIPGAFATRSFQGSRPSLRSVFSLRARVMDYVSMLTADFPKYSPISYYDANGDVVAVTNAHRGTAYRSVTNSAFDYYYVKDFDLQFEAAPTPVDIYMLVECETARVYYANSVWPCSHYPVTFLGSGGPTNAGFAAVGDNGYVHTGRFRQSISAVNATNGSAHVSVSRDLGIEAWDGRVAVEYRSDTRSVSSAYFSWTYGVPSHTEHKPLGNPETKASGSVGFEGYYQLYIRDLPSVVYRHDLEEF